VSQRSDVLRVPNTAIRFRPSVDVFAALNQPVPPEALGGGRGRRGGAGGAGGGANRADNSGSTTPRNATSSSIGASASAQEATRPNAGGAAGGRGRGFGNDPDRQARFMERFKSMSKDEQQQFIERMKGRGQDTSAFEAVINGKPAAKNAN